MYSSQGKVIWRLVSLSEICGSETYVYLLRWRMVYQRTPRDIFQRLTVIAGNRKLVTLSDRFWSCDFMIILGFGCCDRWIIICLFVCFNNSCSFVCYWNLPKYRRASNYHRPLRNYTDSISKSQIRIFSCMIYREENDALRLEINLLAADMQISVLLFGFQNHLCFNYYSF